MGAIPAATHSMHPAYGILLFLIHLSSLSFASVLPGHPSLPSRQLSHTSLSIRETSIKAENYNLASSASLVKRDWRTEYRSIFIRAQRVGEGWTAHFNLLDMVQSNIDVAAHQLEYFYSAALQLVEDKSTQYPAQLTISVSIGGLKLSFRSHRPIPWDWIQKYLTDLVRETLRFAKQ